jgi:hypothetical protein
MNSGPVTSSKTNNILFLIIKFKLWKQTEFCKTFFYHYVFNGVPRQKNFSEENEDDINKCDSLTMNNEMCKHLVDLYNPSNKCFPNVWCTVFQNKKKKKKIACIPERSIQSGRQILMKTEYVNFTDTVSNTKLKLIFK